MTQCRERYEWEISTVELREICQFRWACSLDASIVMGDWTREEDDKLKLFTERSAVVSADGFSVEFQNCRLLSVCIEFGDSTSRFVKTTAKQNLQST